MYYFKMIGRFEKCINMNYEQKFNLLFQKLSVNYICIELKFLFWKESCNLKNDWFKSVVGQSANFRVRSLKIEDGISS